MIPDFFFEALRVVARDRSDIDLTDAVAVVGQVESGSVNILVYPSDAFHYGQTGTIDFSEKRPWWWRKRGRRLSGLV